ncbi:glycosyltransferase family 4 protein [Spongisporangium articulatum]|uniref:Glycosyltransferase family 4 protein n=1 Tax=Spongisporangium articulatum TaxID=3362603 RepID=A0ABW8ARF7_9ACTN
MQTRPLRVAVLNWRDTTHPEGGGSERYIERIAADLVADGCRVEVLCSKHPGVPRRLRRDGILFRHAGGRWSVYPAALLRLLGQRLRGKGPDVVIDVHNGIPFFARLVAGRPVVVLVHHVHREQWGVVFGRAMAAVGWALESRLSPRVHRGCQYVAVSDVTRQELVGLGVAEPAIAVVHNGTRPVPAGFGVPRDVDPSLVVLGRLVPHKRVEHALQVLAVLRDEFPGLNLRVIGDGWWREELEAEAARLGVADDVHFTGFVDETTKEELLARSWLMLAPSVKEGWGLMVVEAGAHGVPAIAYASAGGLAESISHGRTGLLVDDLDGLVEATRALLRDRAHREALGDAARAHGGHFSWRTASTSMHLLLRRAAAGLPPTSVVDPTAAPNQRVTDGVRMHRRDDGSIVVDLRDPSRHADGTLVDLTTLEAAAEQEARTESE